MNHDAIVEYESERAYGQRAFILHKLDDAHFNALNRDGHVLGLNGYCLDALGYTPAGSMVADDPNPTFPQRGFWRGRQAECARGLTLEDIKARAALAAKLVAEWSGRWKEKTLLVRSKPRRSTSGMDRHIWTINTSTSAAHWELLVLMGR